MIQKVIPAIWDIRPCRNRNTVIQQDGASSHIAENDPEFVAAATEGLWSISLLTQSPKSPDLNVLNLSFFWTLQSHQWRNGIANNLDELIMRVEQAFKTFEPRKLDFGFLTLQCCIDDALCNYDNNNYVIRHMGEEAMLHEGTLPVSIVLSGRALEVFDMMEAWWRNSRVATTMKWSKWFKKHAWCAWGALIPCQKYDASHLSNFTFKSCCSVHHH